MTELILFLGLALLLYSACLGGEFMMDDFPSVVANKGIQRGDWKWVIQGPWRGLLRASYALNAKFHGPQQVVSYHVTNVALHAIAAWLVVQIALALRLEPVLALLAGLVFLAHPLNANAVANISGRSSVLSSVFGFAAIGLTLGGHLFIALPFIALAIWSKEDMVILPLTLAAISGNWAFVLIPAVFAVWRRKRILILLKANGDGGMTDAQFQAQMPQPAYSITALTETALRFPCWMLGLRQNVDPDIRAVSLNSWKVLAAGILYIGGWFVFLSVPSLRLPLTLIALSPMALYLIFPMPDPVMEYRSYASVAGVALLAIELLKNAPEWAWVTLLSWFAAKTAIHAYYWIHPIEYSNAAIRAGSGDKERVLVNLGWAYKKQGMLEEARVPLEKALSFNPKLGPALANLALIELQQGHLDKARDYAESLAIDCPRWKQGQDLSKAVLAEIQKQQPQSTARRQPALVR